MINKAILWILLTCILVLSVFTVSGCIDKQVTNDNNSILDSNVSEEFGNTINNSNNNSIKQNSSENELSLIINLEEPPIEVIGG